MSEGNGSNVGCGGGEVETCWAINGTEDCEVGDGEEVCEIADGTETWRVMDASCCEIWASIATDCCW